MSFSNSQIILHLLSKNGPQTSKQLLSHITEYPQLTSHSFLKSKVLNNMKDQQLIHKKISKNDPKSKNKPLFLWHINEEKINKNAHMKLYPQNEKKVVQVEQEDKGIFIF
ncbi:hypothetical protein C1645_748141 [Glomus cerebriforme]|uniref:Uncharacterized protein n=1 Tax=Glomus cerebriforme TaxID=658196 RepID=A0A397TWB6_9GLOM|nr:hypothetical protein C1645_748141 [Glomus cerebriforme]